MIGGKGILALVVPIHGGVAQPLRHRLLHGRCREIYRDIFFHLVSISVYMLIAESYRFCDSHLYTGPPVALHRDARDPLGDGDDDRVGVTSFNGYDGTAFGILSGN